MKQIHNGKVALLFYCSMDKAYGKVKENISLPPLKVNSQKSFAERQRRLQAIKRTKNKSTPFLT